MQVPGYPTEAPARKPVAQHRNCPALLLVFAEQVEFVLAQKEPAGHTVAEGRDTLRTVWSELSATIMYVEAARWSTATP